MTIIIIIIIIIMSLFKEDDIFSTETNLTHGPLKSLTYLHSYIHMYKTGCLGDLSKISMYNSMGHETEMEIYLKDTRKLYHYKFEVLNIIFQREREMNDPFFYFLSC